MRNNGQTPQSANRDPRRYVDRRLHAHVNVRAAIANCWIFSSCAGDAHLVACCVAKPTPNQRRNADAYKPTGSQ